MKLIDIIQESLIYSDLEFQDKEKCLRFMTEKIAETIPSLDADRVFSVIMDRERLSSTGIGSGIAIPHAKMANCLRHVAAIGRIKTGLPFDAIDKKPVHLIFLILGPEGANETHLKALARISKFLHDTNFRDQLITAKSSQEIFQAISKKDSEY